MDRRDFLKRGMIVGTGATLAVVPTSEQKGSIKIADSAREAFGCSVEVGGNIRVGGRDHWNVEPVRRPNQKEGFYTMDKETDEVFWHPIKQTT